jgi:DNA-binding NarL/FixJ family response regulator
MIQVALVEDDAVLRQFMEDAVNSSPDLMLAGSYSNAEDFKKQFSRFPQLNVVVMDINLPGITGIQCILELKPKAPTIQYLICTVFEDNVNLYNALCAGATGYILKSATEEDMVKAIKDIHAGGSPMSPQIARLVVNSFPKSKANSDLLSQMSKREQEILNLLAAGYRYKEIADKLFLSVETVRTHIRNIYSHLQVHSRTEAINKVFSRD